MQDIKTIINDLKKRVKGLETLEEFLDGGYKNIKNLSETKKIYKLIEKIDRLGKYDEISYLIANTYLTLYFVWLNVGTLMDDFFKYLEKADEYISRIYMARNDTDVLLLKAEIMFRLGEENIKSFDLVEGRNYFLKSVENFEKLKSDDKNRNSLPLEVIDIYLIISCYYIGLVEANYREYDKAIKFYEKSIKAYEEVKESEIIKDSLYTVGVVYHNLGSIYADKGENKKALEFYDKSLSIFKDTDDFESMDYIAGLWMDKGTVYEAMKEYEKALKAYNKSIEIWTDLKNQWDDFRKNEYAMAYNNRGNTYLKLGELDKAMEDYDTSESIIQELIKNGGLYRVLVREDLARVLHNKGIVFAKKRDKEKALQFFDDSIKLLKNLIEDNPEIIDLLHEVERDRERLLIGLEF